ncbi:hypothetical protein [Aquimarina mytili]|uniref:Uncharacterized protein n=1 Tax=Aquimarina mytili TaxID=874423 RepID=A0A937A0G8_9FLAO|nr:hypothetical protein [Aquimarina mytili]MBL0685328.1 hypothetical protein [Aquimarina mytili]
MEHMNVFHRIFHGDLHPLTNQKTKEYYLTYLENKKHDELGRCDFRDLKMTNTGTITLKFWYYQSLFNHTLQNIKWDLHKKLFSLDKKVGDIDHLIKNYQNYVLNYMRIIEQNYLSAEDRKSIFKISEEKTNTDIFKILYKTLDSILLFLEETFLKYIDKSLDIPYQQRIWFAHQNQDTINTIQSKIHSLKVPKIVKDEIHQLLSKIKDNRISNLTYESKEYYSTFIKVLDHLFNKEKLPSKEQLYEVLISLDFNTFKIFFFMTDDIKNKVKSLKNNEDKLKLYREYLKKVKTIVNTIPYRLNPELPPLRKNLLDWVTEEIAFYEELIKFDKSRVLEETFNNRKLLKVSVPEVSLITKLLYESKVIDGPRTELFSFLSKTFRTEKAALISSESLSNNYYSVSESSKRSVKKILKGMLLQLDQMKGEL